MDNPYAKLWVQDFEALPKKEKNRLVSWLRAQADFFEDEAREDEISKGYVARLWPMKPVMSRICPGCRSKEEAHTFDPMECTLVGAFNTPIENIPEVVSGRARALGKTFAYFRVAVGDAEKGSTGLTGAQVKLLEEGRIEERFTERHFKMYVGSIMGTGTIDYQRVMQVADYRTRS
jgi:hypothetical protein